MTRAKPIQPLPPAADESAAAARPQLRRRVPASPAAPTPPIGAGNGAAAPVTAGGFAADAIHPAQATAAGKPRPTNPTQGDHADPADGVPNPQPSTDRLASAALSLLKLDSEMRKTRSLAELCFFIANESRAVTRAQQIAVFERRKGKVMAVRAVTAATRIDRSAPLVLWFEAIAAELQRSHDLGKLHEFDAGAFATELDSVRDAYPLRALLWVPFLDLDGKPIGGMLQARTTPWTDSDLTISAHLASGFAVGWQALDKARPRLALTAHVSRRTGLVAAALLAAVTVLPVSMSALAPVEVAARNPFIVASGVEGVVEQVLVEPNTPVKKGQPLVRLADTVLKNRFEVAEREVVVAETKYKRSAQLAFIDMRGRHEMALSKAELELKTAERDYARDLLARATIRAERDGVAFFGDKRDLVGRPVAVGEKMMEIADPASIEFRIDLGVADAIVLHDHARIRVLLDSDPLHSIDARLVRADYQARLHDGQQLAFRLVAEAAQALPRVPQLGVRGTAQIYSDRVPLAFYLFRRPIAAARHWLGL